MGAAADGDTHGRGDGEVRINQAGGERASVEALRWDKRGSV
jgi:hypothetical protein